MHPQAFSPESPDQLLSTAQVAAWIGMSREQVWRLWTNGQLAGYKLDRHLRFSKGDVEAFLASRYVQATRPVKRSFALERINHVVVEESPSDYVPI